MVFVEDRPFTMLPPSRQVSGDLEDLSAHYPDPPYGAVSAAMDVDMTLAESFSSIPRFPHDGFQLGVDANSLYADASNFGANGKSSPGMYQDDSDLRLPSCNLSTASATSSNPGSPESHHGQLAPVPEWNAPQGLGVSPGIVGSHDFAFSTGTEYSFVGPQVDDFSHFEYTNPKAPGFVDPTLIHPDMGRPMPIQGYEATYAPPPPPPPAYPASPALTGSPLRNGSASPFLHNGYQPYSPFAAPVDPQGRRQSVVSFNSGYSAEQTFSGDEKEKARCPDCGKVFKDLRAHMLTHQTERPEKCPIQTCDYHVKGFARKYDKNRHTLTHYKGTMVCGFCPGSGSAAEKSFNRADVFKRHLTAVHGVEQTAPNSRKKTAAVNSGKKLQGYAPDATGKCSTCSATFSNAQDFYEHLDDCVLRIVQQEDPAEAINAQRLAEVEHDRDVHNTLEKNQLPTTTQTSPVAGEADEEAIEDDDEMAGYDDEDDGSEDDSKTGILKSATTSPTRRLKSSGSNNPPNGVQKSRGLTHSRGGVPLPAAKGGRAGRKNRKDYPSSWGFDKGQMTMRKRVMAVFDGSRRLAKDDMMLSTDNEVRLQLGDGRSYVTDLDVQTLKRAEGFLNATDEEKGVWVSDDPTDEQLKEMLECSKSAAATTSS